MWEARVPSTCVKRSTSVLVVELDPAAALFLLDKSIFLLLSFLIVWLCQKEKRRGILPPVCF